MDIVGSAKMSVTISPFVDNHLMLWINTLRPSSSPALEYRDLCDGVFLSDIMRQIDSSPSYDKITRPADDPNTRQHNMELLVTNIRSYYNEVLQQMILLKMPNVKAIVKDPDKDPRYSDMETILLLILGCAVQSENKEVFIEKIKLLEVDTQHAIVTSIQQITDENVSVMPLTPPDQVDMPYMEKIYQLLFRLLSERDFCAQEACELMQERDYYQSQVVEACELMQERDYYQSQVVVGQNNNASPTPPSAVTPEKHHQAVELADAKAKLRRIRQELEDKMEVMSDMSEELDEYKQGNNKLRNENLELIQDARAARTYRDELDMLKEKVTKVDRYEAEIGRYKEQLKELDFFKTRVQEVREDNAVLAESKGLVEEQLSSVLKRVEMIGEMEMTNNKYRQQINTLNQERGADREKIEMLTEEIARLEFEKKNSMNESATLEHELEEAKRRVTGMSGSLSAQMEETANAKILRLELENKRLLQKVNEMQENSSIEKTAVNLELQRENQRLAKKVESLQETSSKTMNQVVESEAKQKESSLQQQKLSQALDTVRETSQRQIAELETENKHLNQTITTLRERNEKTNDLRMKEVEKENKRLHDNVSNLTQQVSTLSYENRQLHKAYDRLKESSDKISDLENENASLEKENSELHKEVATLKIICDKCEKLEQENNHLDVEFRKLNRANDLLNNAVKKKDDLEREHIDLTVENERLKRLMDTHKTSTSKTVQELESEKDTLSKRVEDLQKKFDMKKSVAARTEQMELDLLDFDNENQKLQKSVETTMKRLKQIEQNNNDLELENENLQKTVETLKLSVKHLEDIEKENADLEVEVSNITRDKSNLEKENRKLKYSLETKDANLDDTSFKLHSLDKEHKSLQKIVERSNSMNLRVREAEKENKELLQQVSMDKKTVGSLRDDLFNEKLKTQQLKNELDKLTHELERVGINKEKLVLVHNTQHESRYKALENMMEDALKKSLELKEEKISALESRLDESKNRNGKLLDDLRMVRHELETIKQRQEEEGRSPHKEGTFPRTLRPPVSPQTATKDILKLKDHLVEVERANATLLAENKSFTCQMKSQTERIRQLDSQNQDIQSQLSSTQFHIHSIQSDNAKLQVEGTTLQSQCASLASQNASLHEQLGNLEGEHDRLVGNHEELQTAHDSLSTDHDALQQLHEQLSNEYEALISEHGSLKSIHKALKTEAKDLKTQLSTFLGNKDDVNVIRQMLEQERDQLKLETKSLGHLQMDYNQLRDSNDKLSKVHDKLVSDYKILLSDHKSVKTEYNKLQSKHDEVQGDLDEKSTNLHCTDIEIATLVKRCEAVEEMNFKVEEDNRQLIYQVQTLLNQNHDLLTQALNSKDHFAEEEKAYMEKLAELRRQKEKLEEKIMEQYKMGKWDNSPRKKGSFGATLVRKARGLLNKARSRSRPNLSAEKDEETVDSVHVNGTKTLPRKFDTLDGRRNSAGSIAGGHRPSPLRKGLAKSTTALNTAGSAEFSIGKPHSVGDGEGYRVLPLSPRDGGCSPLEQVVSLEQFLTESNKSPSSRRKILESSNTLDTNDSGSLDSSSQGINEASQTYYPPPRRQMPQRPQSCVQLTSPAVASSSIVSSSAYHSPVVTSPQTEMNISHISRISTPSMSFNESLSRQNSDSAMNQSNNNSNINDSSAMERSLSRQNGRHTPNQAGITQRKLHERFQSPPPPQQPKPIPQHPPVHRLHDAKNESTRLNDSTQSNTRQNIRPASALPYQGRHTPIIDKAQMLAQQRQRALATVQQSPANGVANNINNSHNRRSPANGLINRRAESMEKEDEPLPSMDDQPFIPKPVPVYRDKNGTVIQPHDRQRSVLSPSWNSPQSDTTRDRNRSLQEHVNHNDTVYTPNSSDFTPRPKSRGPDAAKYSSTPISHSASSSVIHRQYCSPVVVDNRNTDNRNTRRSLPSCEARPDNNKFADVSRSRTSTRTNSNDSAHNMDSSRSDESMSRSFETSRNHTDAYNQPSFDNPSRLEHSMSRSDHPMMYRSERPVSRTDNSLSKSGHSLPRPTTAQSKYDNPMSRSEHSSTSFTSPQSAQNTHSKPRYPERPKSACFSPNNPPQSQHHTQTLPHPSQAPPPHPSQPPQHPSQPPPHPSQPPPHPPRGHGARTPDNRNYPRSDHPRNDHTRNDRYSQVHSDTDAFLSPPDYPAPPRPGSHNSTPMARVLPQTKPSPAPKPQPPPEDTPKGPLKENSVWYEYGCV